MLGVVSGSRCVLCVRHWLENAVQNDESGCRRSMANILSPTYLWNINPIRTGQLRAQEYNGFPVIEDPRECAGRSVEKN